MSTTGTGRKVAGAILYIDIQAGKQHISSPSVSNHNFTREMHVFLDVAMSNRTNVVCLGDLNCDILHPSDNGKEGRAWLDICNECSSICITRGQVGVRLERSQIGLRSSR